LFISSIILVIVILETTFFQDKFGVALQTPPPIHHNDRQLHAVIYLQVAIISQALIFVTRSHGFFFMERPSFALLGAFCIAQLISSIIAAYGDWGFTQIAGISGGWIGIVWVWVCTLIYTIQTAIQHSLFIYRTSCGLFLWTGSSSQ
jgi:H+-transporting ATPase